MALISALLDDMVEPARSAVVGALVAGAAGCVCGLVIGLIAYPPTAWFAIFELGFPAAFIGALGGLVVGLVLRVVRR